MTRAALALICVALLATAALADTHYVSKTGSNTYPYTSWGTATDSIRAALEAGAPWDTIRVAAGQYTADSLPLKIGQRFIGSGMDSTVIRHNGRVSHLVILADSCVVRGLHLTGIIDTVGSELFFRLHTAITSNASVGLISGNRISHTEYGFTGVGSDPAGIQKKVVIDSNEFSSFHTGIYLFGSSAPITGNTFILNYSDTGGAIIQGSSRLVQIERNTFIRSVDFSYPMDIERCLNIRIRNNICINSVPQGPSIRVNVLNSGYPSVGVIDNNCCKGGDAGIISAGGNVYIRNNIVTGTKLLALDYDTIHTSPGYVGHNLYWVNEHSDSTDHALRNDPGNIFADPMFMDSLDFHLQTFSPAIDAGDPSILDPDGSRSDIGPYGGPLGETYTYVDLPPKVPEGFASRIEDTTIYLWWLANQEADLDRYELSVTGSCGYHPSHCGIFPILTPDTTYDYHNYILGGEYQYHFTLRALDAQGNASGWSDTLYYGAADVGDDGLVVPSHFALHPNYPNPFNPNTTLSYTLTSPSTVTLSLFDLLGRHVRTLVQATQGVGEYNVVWDGKDAAGREVASGVYFSRFRAGDEVQTRKMVMVR